MEEETETGKGRCAAIAANTGMFKRIAGTIMPHHLRSLRLMMIAAGIAGETVTMPMSVGDDL